MVSSSMQKGSAWSHRELWSINYTTEMLAFALPGDVSEPLVTGLEGDELVHNFVGRRISSGSSARVDLGGRP